MTNSSASESNLVFRGSLLTRRFYLFSHVFIHDWKRWTAFFLCWAWEQKHRFRYCPPPVRRTSHSKFKRWKTAAKAFRGPESNVALTSLAIGVGLPQRSTVFHGTEAQHMVLHIHIISLSTNVYFGACTSAAVSGKMDISSYHPLTAASQLNCWLLPYHLSIDLVSFLFSSFF